MVALQRQQLQSVASSQNDTNGVAPNRQSSSHHHVSLTTLSSLPPALSRLAAALVEDSHNQCDIGNAEADIVLYR